MIRPVVMAALLAAGCAADAQGSAPLAPLDAERYAAWVQPVVGRDCGTLDCHGVGLRPLRIYAVDGLRIDPAARGEPIRDDELAWNVAAFEAIDPAAASVDDHVALLKPLAVEAGGLAHEGDPVYATSADPGFRCLRAWLADEPDDGACEAAAPPAPSGP